jgi:hypothetical protein
VDSGKTWPYVLAPNTPNDGSETIGVPNVQATWARVKVKGDNNVFFDLNDNWIEIKKLVSPTGLQDLNESAIEIYPNPSKGDFNISLPSDLSNASLEVVNTVGAVLHTQKLNSNETAIHLSAYAKGIYFIKLKTANSKVIVKKVVVE